MYKLNIPNREISVPVPAFIAENYCRGLNIMDEPVFRRFNTEAIKIIGSIRINPGTSRVFGYFIYRDKDVYHFCINEETGNLETLEVCGVERVLDENTLVNLEREWYQSELLTSCAFDINTTTEWINEHGSQADKDLREFMDKCKACLENKNTRIGELQHRLVEVLTALDEVAPVKFCTVDTDESVYNFSGITYEPSDNRVYIDLSMYSDSLPSHKPPFKFNENGKEVPYVPYEI